MEARIALASLVVFAGVLTAGMVVTRVNGDDAPSSEFAESDLRAAANQVPVEFGGTGSLTTVESLQDEGTYLTRSNDDWDDDDRYEDDWDDDDWDDDDWDDDHERNHDDDDEDDDDDRDEDRDREYDDD